MGSLRTIPRLHACLLGLIVLGALNFYVLDSPVSIGVDPNEEQCLPDVHVSVLFKNKPVQAVLGDYVFWRPQGPLKDVKQAFIMKRVGGVAGDHLVIKDETIFVNGIKIAQGLALIDRSKVQASAFERDDVIPEGKVFLVADHPMSFDSRYWGYLDVSALEGKAYVLF
jgi:conjugal transfer pilin signal peptidase TrbI